MTAVGYGLCVGLNAVDAAHYGGWDGRLNACEADASDMTILLHKQGFKVTQLLTAAATATHVIAEITRVAALAKAGDIFVFTNSSHGGQLPDLNGDESDDQDETICMFDREIVDDELWGLWSKFAPGVRILVLSDSCHSGTVTRASMPYHDNFRTRMLPPDVALATYHANQHVYDPILTDKSIGKDIRAKVQCSVLALSGCADNQTSGDGEYNGVFTGALKRVWNAGRFTGSYYDLRTRVVAACPSYQTPHLTWAGVRNLAFEKAHPFTI